MCTLSGLPMWAPTSQPTLSPCPVEAQLAQVQPMWAPHVCVCWGESISNYVGVHIIDTLGVWEQPIISMHPNKKKLPTPPPLPVWPTLLRWAETLFFYVHLDVQPLFFLCQPQFGYPPQPHNLTFLASTSEINTSTSHSDNYNLFLSPCSPLS